MRNPERINRILNLIQEIWSLQPDTRFLQLIDNLTVSYSKQNDNRLHDTVYRKLERNDVIVFQQDVIIDGFNVEDERFEEFLKDYLEILKVEEKGIIIRRVSGKLKKKYGI